MPGCASAQSTHARVASIAKPWPREASSIAVARPRRCRRRGGRGTRRCRRRAARRASSTSESPHSRVSGRRAQRVARERERRARRGRRWATRRGTARRRRASARALVVIEHRLDRVERDRDEAQAVGDRAPACQGPVLADAEHRGASSLGAGADQAVAHVDVEQRNAETYCSSPTLATRPTNARSHRRRSGSTWFARNSAPPPRSGQVAARVRARAGTRRPEHQVHLERRAARRRCAPRCAPYIVPNTDDQLERPAEALLGRHRLPGRLRRRCW